MTIIKKIVKRMLTAYKFQGYQMSLKVYFLYSYLEYFPQNLYSYREEQWERFHKVLRTMGKRHQARMGVNMMGDNCWMLKGDNAHKGSCKRSGRSIKNNKKLKVSLAACGTALF